MSSIKLSGNMHDGCDSGSCVNYVFRNDALVVGTLEEHPDIEHCGINVLACNPSNGTYDRLLFLA